MAGLVARTGYRKRLLSLHRDVAEAPSHHVRVAERGHDERVIGRDAKPPVMGHGVFEDGDPAVDVAARGVGRTERGTDVMQIHRQAGPMTHVQ